jgi:membrane protease YdiL (CAAX protease family)
MLFSPIGEEVLYRGVAHASFATRLGDARAAVIDAGAFAVTHLAHFGVVFVAGAWAFLPAPAAFWVAAMFLASLVFHGFRQLTGSLGGAIASHAGFNLAMNWVIFYAIIP